MNLSENRIDKGEAFEGHPKLVLLNMRKNRLNNIVFVKDMPSLVELYLVKKEKELFGLIVGRMRIRLRLLEGLKTLEIFRLFTSETIR